MGKISLAVFLIFTLHVLATNGTFRGKLSKVLLSKGDFSVAKQPRGKIISYLKQFCSRVVVEVLRFPGT